MEDVDLVVVGVVDLAGIPVTVMPLGMKTDTPEDSDLQKKGTEEGVVGPLVDTVVAAVVVEEVAVVPMVNQVMSNAQGGSMSAAVGQVAGMLSFFDLVFRLLLCFISTGCDFILMFASNDLKREGGGRANWGTTEDDIPP